MEENTRLSRVTAEATQAFAAHCLADPTHEIGLLATSPHFPGGNGQDRWMVYHWVGKNKKVRPAPIPEGVDLGQVTGAAMTEEPTSNLAMWLIGLRPGTRRLNVRAFVTPEDPVTLVDSDQWAMSQIMSYAQQLAAMPEAVGDETPGGASTARRQARSSTTWWAKMRAHFGKADQSG